MVQKLIKYLPWILFILIALFLLKTCNDSQKHKNELDSLHSDYDYMEQMNKDNKSTLKRDTTEKGEELISQKALYVEERKQRVMLETENKNLKSILSETRVRTETVIKNIETVTRDTVLISTGDSVSALIFYVNNEWYGVSGKVIKKEVTIDSLYTREDIVTTIGFKKDKGLKNFFKSPYPVVEVINKSSHSRVKTLHNVVIKPRKKRWHKTKAAMFVAGTAAGLYLGYKATR